MQGATYWFNPLIKEKKMDPFRKLTKMKTLLVDDDEIIRDSLSLAFRRKGCFLQAAESAEEGLHTLGKESFDIIISDFKLPGIDGLKFLKQATAFQPNTAGVIISSYRNKFVTSRAFPTGVHAFIEKPFSIEDLMESLSRLIEERNAIGCKPDEEAQSEVESKTHGKVTADDTSRN